LPGGFVDMDEDIDTAAHRELAEETGVVNVFIEQLYTFGAPNRDPRGRVVSVAYYALVNLDIHPVTAASDANRAEWFAVSELPRMAFDHNAIVKMAITRLQSKLRYQPIGFELLSEQFSLSELQGLYETILQKKLNKRNFRSKILKMGILKQVGSQEKVSHRPASLFSFDKDKYDQLVEIGFVFEL
jgi:8-oxo-dGTP diphosphatase